MIKQFLLGILVVALIAASAILFPFQSAPTLAPSLARKMGMQIWQNECAGKKEGLTTWNKGEEFASLGIGHFIWYPEGIDQRFKQSFPDLLFFLESHAVVLPLWLQQAKGCPWRTREEFQAAQNQSQLLELRDLLAEHIDLQILFIVKRLERALPALLNDVEAKDHSHVVYQFYRLTQTPGGLFV